MTVTTEPAGVRPAQRNRHRTPRKCVTPRVDVAVLPRPRLWDRLDECLRCRAVLIRAPAGFGKTVLCASWLARRPPSGRVAWVTLDAGDRERARFWGYVQTALFGSVPVVPHGDDKAEREIFLDRIVSELGQPGENLTLVLDDIHEISGSPSSDDLDFLLRHAPATFRVILVGRSIPGLQLARLRLSGDLATIGSADLAATHSEARKFLHMQGIAIDEAELVEFLTRTEGWMGGLRLTVLGSNGATTGRDILSHRTGDNELVTDYVRDEFLAGHPREIREFLLRTSIAEHLTGDLADSLSGRSDSAHILDWIGREHGFVEGVDGQPGTFRYHPMIQDVLKAELGREFPREMSVLQRALGRWHREHGRPADALRCAMAASDVAYACGLLATDDITLLTSDAAAEVDGLLDELTADRGADDTAVMTARAAARLRRGDAQDALAFLREAELTAAGEPTQSAWLYRLKHAALRLAIAVQDGQLDREMQVGAWQALDSAPETPHGIADRRARGWLLAILGITHLGQGELQPARYALRLAERDLATVGPHTLHERIVGWLALAEASDGRLRVARRLGAQVTDGSPIVGLARTALAWARVELGELAQADQQLATVHPWPAEPLLAEPASELILNAVRLRLAWARRDTAGAWSALARAHDAAGPYASALAPILAVANAAIASSSGDASIETRLSQVDWPDDNDRAVWPLARDLLRVWRTVGDDPAAALAILPEIASDPRREIRLLDRISAVLASAVAHRRLGQKDLAARRLEEALGLAEPEGARQVFVDGGPSVRVLLTVFLPAESRFAAFRAEILRRFELALRPWETKVVPEGGVLTESELAILRFLPTHLTNEEIASDLFISVNTVKTHVRSIYRKLGVGSRRAAIRLAGRRGLL